MNVKSPASTNVTPPPNASIDQEATTANLVMVSVLSSLSNMSYGATVGASAANSNLIEFKK